KLLVGGPGTDVISGGHYCVRFRCVVELPARLALRQRAAEWLKSRFWSHQNNADRRHQRYQTWLHSNHSPALQQPIEQLLGWHLLSQYTAVCAAMCPKLHHNLCTANSRASFLGS